MVYLCGFWESEDTMCMRWVSECEITEDRIVPKVIGFCNGSEVVAFIPVEKLSLEDRGVLNEEWGIET